MSGRMEIMSPESWRRIEQIAVDHGRFFTESLMESMLGSKDEAYGEVMLTPADRIARFMDDEATGVNEQIKAIDPDEYMARVKQFAKDVERRGLA